ncbi:MAG: SCO family protein [Caldilineales bacterium]|nr:SCO family protein [Caldilineales bacterium]
MTASVETPPLFPRLDLRSWQGVALALLACLILAVLAFVIFQPIQVLPRMRLAPGFALIDQDGRPLTNEDLRGQFVLYNFTYSRCQPPDCGNYDQIMREVQQRMGEIDLRGQRLALVTISVDAAHDTPAVLQRYAQGLEADAAVWQFASAAPERLKQIVGGGFEVFYEAEGEEVQLSPTMILVDGWGIVRAVYHMRTTPPETERILRHVELLAVEVAQSKGVARLGYEAAHLFLCYAS